MLSSLNPKYTREQFVNFMIPKNDYKLCVPEGYTEEDVLRCESPEVSSLKTRWRNGTYFIDMLNETWKVYA